MANKSLMVATVVGLMAAVAAQPRVASAQCMLCDEVTKTAAKARAPLNVQVEASIDFSMIGLITAGQGGTASLDPVTGQRILTGNLVNLSGIPVVGTVLVRGEPNSHVDVTLPSAVQLTNSTGARYQLANFTTTLKNNPKLAKDGILRFTFGALLRVDGTATGRFRGSIPITVEYK